MSTVSCKSCTIFCYAKKEKYLHEICLLLQEFFSTGLLNLYSQIRCAENRYTAVEIDINAPWQICYFLKYLGHTFHLVFNSQKFDGFSISIILLRSNTNSAKQSVIMQKRHSRTTYSEDIRCFSLNGHFSRKNLVAWPPFTKHYKHTNSAQVTCFIIVNFGLDMFFISLFLLLLRILFLNWPRGLVQGYHLRRLSLNSRVFSFYFKVNPFCLYDHDILLFIKFNANKNG